MRTGKFLVFACAIAALGASLGCASGGSGTSNQPLRSVRIATSALPVLQNGYHYEGWAAVGGATVSTGKFVTTQNGSAFTLGGSFIPNGDFILSQDVTAATALMITIEPPGDANATPSATKFLSGTVSGGAATLSPAGALALGSNFSAAVGKFVLQTPTDGANTNERSGAWFLTLPAVAGGANTAGLQIPALPAGWKYEGWAIINGTPISMGKFTSVSRADEASLYKGAQTAPLFPGEDFLQNAPAGFTFPLDLTGAQIVVSIEPFPDDSPAPFVLKPLAATVAATHVDHTSISMTNQAGTFPSLTATIR